MPRISSIPSGSISIFKQSTAILGWTKLTDIDDHTLRVVNTSGGGISGTTNFSTVFSVRNVTGAVPTYSTQTGSYTLTGAEIPAHNHSYMGVNGTAPLRQQGPPYPGYYAMSAPSVQAYPTGDAGNYPTFGTDYLGQYPAPVLATAWGGTAHSHPVTISTTFAGGTVDMRIKYVDVIRAQKD